MGTRSSIAVKHGDKIKAVYCHWNGYLDHNGIILSKCYSSALANNLVALGNISSLGATIGAKHDFDTPNAEREFVDIGPVSVNKETTFYGRDRGEEDSEYRVFHSEAEWIDTMEASGCEYFYLMDSDVWYVCTGGNLMLLHDALEDQHFSEEIEND